MRRIWLAALAASAVGVADGQEPPPAAQSAGDAGIAGARKEFQSVKSSDNPALQPKAALPRLAAPDFHGGAGATAPGSWTQKQKAADKKPSNWLLDAMEKSERRDPRSRERPRDEKESDPAATDATTGEVALAADRDERVQRSEVEERDRKSAAAALNPLTPFLNEWMTPQDYALLKPGMRSTDAELASGVLLGIGGVAGTPDSSIRLTVPGLQGPEPSLIEGERAARRENPYLQNLNTVPVATKVAPPISSPAHPAPILSAPPAAPGKPKVPDFVKPANDEKYFKQLKRF